MLKRIMRTAIVEPVNGDIDNLNDPDRIQLEGYVLERGLENIDDFRSLLEQIISDLQEEQDGLDQEDREDESAKDQRELLLFLKSLNPYFPNWNI